MSKVQALTQEGLLQQDATDSERVVYNVPIRIKKTAIEAGALELFAKAHGWTEKILDDNEQEIDNPEKAHERCNQVVKDFVSQTFQSVMQIAAVKQAQEIADQQIRNLI